MAAVFHRDQEVSTTLFEAEEKGRLACNESACTSSPSSSTRASRRHSAAISPRASVALVLWPLGSPGGLHVIAYKLIRLGNLYKPELEAA